MGFFRMFKVGSVLILAMVASVMSSGIANGDIIFSVEVDPPVNAGDDATVSFFGTSTAVGGESLSGFNLPIDIGGDGFAPLASGLTIDLDETISLLNPISGSFSHTIGGPQNSGFSSDLIVNISGAAAFAVEETETLLFDLIIGTDSSTPIGIYDVLLVDSPFFSVTAGDGLTNVTAASSFAPAAGSIEISAVPEPTSTALLGLVALTGLAIRRRK